MKKLALISTLVLATTAVSAADIGIRTIRHDGNATFNGVTLNTKVGPVNTEVAYDRFNGDGGFTVDRVSALGVVGLTKIGPVSIDAKAGVARLNASNGLNGSAFMYGLGAAYPLTKKVSFAFDVIHMNAQNRINAADGTSISAGLKFAF